MLGNVVREWNATRFPGKFGPEGAIGAVVPVPALAFKPAQLEVRAAAGRMMAMDIPF